jgi:Tfp pilus assembly protein PilE
VKKTNAKGQAVVEYIIIIVIVAIAALVVLGAFSDRLRTMIAGVTTSLGGDASTDVSTKSVDKLKELKETGTDTTGN